MTRLRRFIHPGVAISVIGHLGALMLGLLFAGANPFESMPPDAMLVDIVSSTEVPRLEGTPADAASSGSEAPSNSNSPSAEPQPPRPTAASPQQPQQPQQRQNSPRNARQATAQPQPPQPVPAQSRQAEPLTPPTTTTTPPTPPQPRPEDEPDRPGVGQMFALPLALPGGRLGGGFDAPAIDAAQIAHDDTAAFREHVSSCSALPPGIAPDERIRIVLRVSFKPDGTLASQPQLIEASASAKGPALMQSAVSALQKCQPYTMLPADKYKEWKTLDLSFTPLNFPVR